MEEGLQSEPQEDVLLEMPDPGLANLNIICRLCANPNDRIIGIYSDEGISNDLANKMNLYLPVKVSEGDTLPLQCCWSCASTVLAWHELVLASVEADRRLRGLEDVEKPVPSEDDFGDLDDGGSPMSDERIERLEEDNSAESMFLVKKEEPDTADEKPRHCSQSAVSFPSETLFNLHQSQKHAGGLVQCDFCDATFKRRCYMLKHARAQHPHQKKQAEEPGEPVKAEDASEEDSATSDPLRWQDDSKIKEDLDESEQKDAYKCEACDKEFKRKAALNKHLKEEHGQQIHRRRRQKNEIIAEFFCDVCERGFTRKFDMQKHRKSKHPAAPQLEEDPTPQQKNLQLLQRCKVAGSDNTSYYKCPMCDKIFRQTYNFMRHQTVHTGIRAYFCHICGKNFRVSGGLHRHITEHHYGVKKFKCDVCGKSFAAKATRDDHRNIHSGDRPFVCDVCGKAFRQKASLHIHKLFHSDNYRFSCSICGKKYRRASELKIHSWIHTGHKPHQCSLCGSRFRLRQDLKRHIKIHDKLNECVCNECGSTFSQERYLKNHKKTHQVKPGMVTFVVPPLL